MNKAQVETKLTKLNELRCQEDAVRLRYRAEIDALKAPVQERIDELLAAIADDVARLELACASELDEVANEAAELEAAVRLDVVALGESVKVPGLQAVYVKPRVTWDSKALDGYAVAHPELFAFRREGEAGVQIRKA